MRVLIIQTAFIGDAILASAALEALHAHAAVSSVSLMLRKGNHGLFRDHPFLSRLHVLDKSLGKLTQIKTMVREIRAERYDLVINLQRFMTTGLITLLSGAKEKMGYDKNPLSWAFTHRAPHEIGDGRHEVDRMMDLLECTFERLEGMPMLYPTEADFAKVARQGAYVCMAPSSVWFTKQWPVDKWKALIDRMPAEVSVLLLGGPGDRELCAEIMEQAKHPKVENLSGEIDLLQSAALMKNAQMNYVNDSAPLHLCSAMDAPVTAFFCSTVPRFGFGPLSSRQHIMEHEAELPCRPCGLHGKKACPLGHFKCSDINLSAIPIPR